MINETVVELSRLQFAMTALYHFLFVPLTLGLSFMVAIMESVYVMSGRQIWRDITKFWGLLFGINFAMGVATGIVMEFQFGMNWSYYSHYVGDIFGAPLAIEALMAFFLEATFVGLMFLGWDRLSKVKHLFVTWMVALGSNLSALWILVANGWMQHPAGAKFNPDTMRMEIQDFVSVIFNPVAQSKFVHTVSAGYVCAAIFVVSISAIYLLQKRNIGFAKRSITVAAAFGLASALSVVVLGDESGYTLTDNQKMKLAVMESMWEPEEAPASFTLFGIPDTENRTTHYEVKVPYALGLIATRSLDKPVASINELVMVGSERIQSGAIAYHALQQLMEDRDNAEARATLDQHAEDLGFGMLLLKYTEDPINATPEQIAKASWDLVPYVGPLFWGFRVMVALGFFFIGFFAWAFYLATVRRLETRSFLILAVCSLPLPWIAIEAGWFIAEYGRQPWVIEGVLPTFLAASKLSVVDLAITIAVYVTLYTTLAVIEVRLMMKYIKRGPYPEATPGTGAGYMKSEQSYIKKPASSEKDADILDGTPAE